MPNLEFAASEEELSSWDVLANDAMLPLVNDRVAELLRRAAPDEVELIEASVQFRGGPRRTYFVVNALMTVNGIDHSRTQATYIPGTRSIMGFRRLAHRDDALGALKLAREREYLGHLLVSDEVAAMFNRERVRGVTLISADRISW